MIYISIKEFPYLVLRNSLPSLCYLPAKIIQEILISNWSKYLEGEVKFDKFINSLLGKCSYVKLTVSQD